MEIRNIETGVRYKMSKESWNKLGKRKKLFEVISDEEPKKEIPVKNKTEKQPNEKPQVEKTKTKIDDKN